MSLECAEHDNSHALRVGQSIFGAINPNTRLNAVFCRQALDMIPTEARLRSGAENLIGIWRGSSRPTWSGPSSSYTQRDLRYIELLFYVTPGSLRRYLPNVAEVVHA